MRPPVHPAGGRGLCGTEPQLWPAAIRSTRTLVKNNCVGFHPRGRGGASCEDVVIRGEVSGVRRGAPALHQSASGARSPVGAVLRAAAPSVPSGALPGCFAFWARKDREGRRGAWRTQDRPRKDSGHSLPTPALRQGRERQGTCAVSQRGRSSREAAGGDSSDPSVGTSPLGSQRHVTAEGTQSPLKELFDVGDRLSWGVGGRRLKCVRCRVSHLRYVCVLGLGLWRIRGTQENCMENF